MNTPKTPFQRVTDDLTGGCGCACHTGTGYRTSCEHCEDAPWIYTTERVHPHSLCCASCKELREAALENAKKNSITFRLARLLGLRED